MKRALVLLSLWLGGGVFLVAQDNHARLEAIWGILRDMEIGVGYARPTLIPFYQLDWMALAEYISIGGDHEKPFWLDQPKAWASMGTYFGRLFEADPLEFNLPAIELTVRHRAIHSNQHDYNTSFVRVVTSPFLAWNSRLFFFQALTGYEFATIVSFGEVRTSLYAHVGMIGSENTNLFLSYFDNLFPGIPSLQVVNYGLGYVMAGSGFYWMIGLGKADRFLFFIKLFMELSAFLPFAPSGEVGIDVRAELTTNPWLMFYAETRLAKTLWQTGGVSVGAIVKLGSILPSLDSIPSDQERGQSFPSDESDPSPVPSEFEPSGQPHSPTKEPQQQSQPGSENGSSRKSSRKTL